MDQPPAPSYLLLPCGGKFLLTGNVSIGRSDQNPIALKGEKVSRIHAHLYHVAGRYQVVDSQSRNGTYVNRQRIIGQVTLKSGDQVGIGGHTLIYWEDQEAPPSLENPSFGERTIEAVEKTLTWLLVLDIKDSTNLAFQQGVEGYASLVSAWFGICREIIEKYGGAINKSTGDGLLAYWKDSDGTRAETVATALQELRRLQAKQSPAFRLVVHYGLVAIGGGAGMGEEPLSGPEVHLIFRAEKGLSQSPSDFGATEAAAWALERWMSRVDLEKFSPKGFEGQYQLYHLEPIEPG
jgi:class 3 adenylate cyclase